MKTIYLDHAATTPLHPEVREAMLPYLGGMFGNPSSIHSYGRATGEAVRTARDLIADKLGCGPQELIFTASGSESDNLAIIGAVEALRKDRKRPVHVITTQIEHHAVLGACRRLEDTGVEVTYLPVDVHGRVSVDDVAAAIRPETALISVMFGNNEVGTLQPIEEIGALARERGILFHVDAVQALGMVPIRLSELPVDLMSFAAHKINGPMGIGLLYVSRRVRLAPLVSGGNQERKRRAGTENVPGIVGFARAVELAVDHVGDRSGQCRGLGDELLRQLGELLPEGAFALNGHPSLRLPHIVNVSFPGVSSETMLMKLDLNGIAAASGSACSSGSLEPSHVLMAMGLPDERVRSAVRFSFGFGNVHEDVTFAANLVATIVRQLRK